MKCGLFNDPFDYYGHIGSGNGNRLHKLLGNGRGGWIGSETMKDDTFLRSARNPRTAMSGTRTTNLQIYSSARYHRANPTPARKRNSEFDHYARHISLDRKATIN